MKGIMKKMVHTWMVVLVGLILTGTNARAQNGGDQNMWKTLAKITYKKEYDEFLGFKIDKPVFSDAIKELEGKEVTIKGYIIPVEGYKSHHEFIFSAYPYNMCFFCGGAGPETVMEVVAADAVKYSADPIVLSGILRLNADDINSLMFKLENARKVSQ